MTNPNILDSIVGTLNPRNILKKLGIMLLFISILGLDKLIKNLDLAFRGEINFFSAIYTAYQSAFYRAFGTIYPVILDIVTFQFEYFKSQSYGTLVFALFFSFFLISIIYQPISLLYDIIFGQSEHVSSTIMKLIATVLIVMLLSAIVYYVFGETGISYPIINETINSTITNVTDNSTGRIPVINLV